MPNLKVSYGSEGAPPTDVRLPTPVRVPARACTVRNACAVMPHMRAACGR